MPDGCHEWANAYFTHVEKTSFFSVMPAFVYLIAGWQIIKNIPVLFNLLLKCNESSPKIVYCNRTFVRFSSAVGA